MDYQETIARMHNRQLYFCDEPTLLEEQRACLKKVQDYNRLGLDDPKAQRRLLEEMFAEIGEGSYIEPPFYANWGGKFVRMGQGVYANFGLTLVDDTEIRIGDHVLFGPHVTVCTATHPIHPALRSQQAQYNLPVTIGANVWIGGHAMILPGVTIGENSVIGAGSIVNRDIPANVVAVGNPCRVLREISGHDWECYYQDMRIDI